MLRIRFVLAAVLSTLAVLAGCGGSGITRATPPPGGGFTNSHLTGTYVFSVTGTDGTGDFFTMAGTFIANGSGGISGGVLDLNDTRTGPVLSQPITGGSYLVGVDGRPASQMGLLTLQTGSANLSFDFVLTSSTHGLITEFDTIGSGSGTFDLQANVTQANINNQSYAFSLFGTSGIGTDFCGIGTNGSVTPFATVGAVTLDASGNVASGVQDFNDNCNSVGGTDLSVSAGFIDLTTVPGTASFTTSLGTVNFDVFPVTATHLKLIEIDTTPIMAGDAFTATASVPAGNNVFTLSGFDLTNQAPFVTAGIIDTDGSGGVNTDSVQDINDGGVYSQVTSGITGSYTAVSGGRSVLTLTSGFLNGDLGCTNCQFAAYPSSGGLQLLEIDNGGMTGGIAYPQTATALASSQGFGMNLSAANPNSVEDVIAEFTNDNGRFTGIVDFNDQGSTVFGQRFTSTYAADSTVPGRGVVTPGANGFNLVTYAVNNSTAIILEADQNQLGLGAFVMQNAGASSNLSASRLMLLRTTTGAKALKRAAKARALKR